MGRLNKLSKMKALIKDVKIIFENINLKICGSEDLPLNRYRRTKMEIYIMEREKISNFCIFSEEKGVQAWNFARLAEAEKAHPKTIDLKSVKLEGSRMLRYGDFSD